MYVSCAETTVKKIEDTFKDFTNRDDIAIILINQHIANMIRHLIDGYIQVHLVSTPDILAAIRAHLLHP